MRLNVKTHENNINKLGEASLLKSTQRRPVIHNIPDHWSREKKIEQLLGIAEVLKVRWQNLDRGTVTMDPEDIYQIAAIAITKAVDNYNPAFGTKLTTWVMTQAQFAVREQVRRSTHTKRSKIDHVRWVSLSQMTQDGTGDTVSLEELISETVHTPGSDIIETLHKNWEQQQLRDYLTKLTPRERAVMELYIQERSVSFIAKEIGLGNSRVYQIIESATNKMRGFNSSESAVIKTRQLQEGILEAASA